MADATTDFFESLSRRGHEPLLEKARGTLRIDLDRGKRTEHWFVKVDKGDIQVSHRDGKADSSIRARKDVFDGIARGETNAMAAVLRGAVAIDGDFELIVLFQRLFPGARRGAEATPR
jgi:putative sterol carrier protein